METLADVTPNGRRRFALFWIGLISAWVLTGAAFKLFWGTPALLPAVVRDLPLELGLTYNLAIGIELAVAGVSLSRPRWGWVLQVVLLLAFDAVLVTQIAAGETNCGCFGAKVSVPPWLMLVIDSSLLLGLLASRPWARLGAGPSPTVPVAVAALALALPWLLDRQVRPGQVVADGKPVEGDWIDLRIRDWIGMDVWDTALGREPLSRFLDVNALPLDGLWVFWRQTCEHCAKHLARLAESEHGERLIALIQLEEKTDTPANRVVHAMPDGNFVQHARLPPSIAYVLQTPAELVLEGGRIVAAHEAVE
jgi:hypothetical protein